MTKPTAITKPRPTKLFLGLALILVAIVTALLQRLGFDVTLTEGWTTEIATGLAGGWALIQDRADRRMWKAHLLEVAEALAAEPPPKIEKLDELSPEGSTTKLKPESEI